MNGKAPALAAREQPTSYSVTSSPSTGEGAHSIPSPLTGEGQGGGESKTILLPHLDLFPAAPEGFKRLRELVLNLAVRGRLVPQDPADEPADRLLARIREEKARLAAEGKIRREKPLEPIAEDEKPFALPSGWSFARFGQLALSIVSGGTPSKQNPAYWDGNIRWASVKDLGFGGPIWDTRDRITELGLKEGAALAPAGAIVICTRMGLGKIGEAMVDLAINQDLKAVALSEGINKTYFINFYKTLSLTGSGMTVAGIKQDELLSIAVPVPPLAEQSRIVAKVEELMALIGRLEAKSADAEAARGKLLQALLAALADSPDAAATTRSWGELAPHFDWLLQTPQDVDRLQQTVLQLAVKGRLAPQNPADEPAAQLLQRIRAEKARLAAAGKLKRDKPLPPITAEEQLYALPEGWEWVRLGELIVQGPQNGFSPKPVGHVTDVRCLSLSATTSGFFKDQWFKYVDISLAQAEPYFLKGGDFLVQRANSLEYVGVSAIYKGEDDLFIFPDLMMRFRVAELEEGYLHTALLSAFCREFFRSKATGTQGNMPKINQGTLISAPIPLPPLTEQSRIVAQVEALTALCDRLRQGLAARSELAGKLAGAMVEEAGA